MPVLRLMSKKSLPISAIFGSILLILQFFTNVDAQDLDVHIKINSRGPAMAEVEGRYSALAPPRNARNLTFLNDYAGVTGLAERISNLGLADSSGSTITNRRFAAGEYVASQDISLWRYEMALVPLSRSSAAAHTSWIKGDIGVIMLDDLLPQGGRQRVSAKVKFDLPTGWTAYSTARISSDSSYYVDDIEKASFVLGRNWREVNAGQLKLLISGEWQFTDDEAAKIVSEVFYSYKMAFGSVPSQNVQIAMVKFPNAGAMGNWEADTRGQNVTILSSDMPFKNQSLQRLHEQLRHEVFHLWIPNGLNLSGNYDWFYEGFALYQSLKIGVSVNRLRFDDMLDTLSRAMSLDAMRTQKMSLIDASKNRWNGANTQIYARGMLAAFMCDLAMLERSKGRRSVSDLLSEIYNKHRPPAANTDGTAAILTLFRNNSELSAIVERIIVGTEDIEWPTLLKPAGIEAEIRDQVINLRVTAKPSGRQKEILDKLGYNNWRKLSSK